MRKKFILAMCQLMVKPDKNINIRNAVSHIKEAASKGAELVVLPEMFNCPYDSSYFPEFAETVDDGITIKAMSEAASENNVYLVAGSIPEKEGSNIYNTSFVFNRSGELIGRHRKVHLFDVDVKGGVYFKESDRLSAGNQITVIDTELCRIGVAICYDMRFPELLRIMALKGAEVIAVPAAFNMTTGPVHWAHTIHARAIDNQVYMAAVSPARDCNASYVAYGNSMLVDPWGKAVACTDERETLITGEIDIDLLVRIREQLPLLKHRREDIYSVEYRH